jgi:hypothetical protein
VRRALARSWQWVRRLPPPVVLATAWLLAVLYAYPGYMNWDSADQLRWAREQNWDDWHPPLMSRYWRIVEHVIHGPFGMLVIQMTVFLLALYGLLRQRFRPRTAAWTAAALLLFPPILTPMAVVWKDAQMAAWLLAGTAALLRPSWAWRGVGLVLLVLAGGVRDNAFTALPSLCLLFAARAGVRHKLAIVGASLAIFFSVTAASFLVNKAITDVHSYAWYKGTAIHDLAGALCLEEPMSDEQVEQALQGIPTLIHKDLQANLCKDYDPRWWFPLTFGDNDFFKQFPDAEDRRARKHAWYRILRQHTSTYLSHRWRVFRELLGLTDDRTNEPVCQTFAANEDQLRLVHHDATLSTYQALLGNSFVKLSSTILFQPWAYLVGCFVLMIYALFKRDRLVLALVTSGVTYELAYFVAAPGPAYRYSHWMIVCCCLGIAFVFGERLKSGSRQDPGDADGLA